MGLANLLRLVFSVATIVFLTTGYVASQYASMTGVSADYARRVDAFPIRALALLLLIGAIVSAALPPRSGNS